MELKRRIKALVQLGEFLGNADSESIHSENINVWETVLEKAKAENGWFTLENLLFALKSWSNALTEENLKQWCANYDCEKNSNPKINTVAIIMAGNIPLVGFHDFISVLITGNKVLAKLSSNDKTLLPFIAKNLISIEPEFQKYIEFAEGKLENFDAVIATGSNNTSRYFDYYFGKYPHIIRKNRNSIAVLTGEETAEELTLLADDIFRYFGLGCRNVSKLYVPLGYDFEKFFNAIFSWKEIIHNHKYINNYDYNKAVYLMDSLPLLDNEFLLLKEDSGLSSPIAVLFYEKYSSLSELKNTLELSFNNIQCIVSKNIMPKEIPFGQAQSPELWDYADGVDTIDFLLKLS